jgi:phosphoribosylformimino-5-aminoimidazole carboxamide ribotide isomerase
MQIIPAIDIKDGKCVRLRQGRANEVSVYGDDPVAMAQHWEQEGAKYLHVVDLDGAFQGRPVHGDLIARMAKAVRIPMEVGGGLRTDDDIRAMLDRGVDRVVVGTRACADSAGLSKLAATFGIHLAVGIDARGGRIQIKGWVETTTLRAVDLARRAQTAGIRWIIYTDTSKDGMMTGLNTAAVAELCDAVSCQIIASGGVSSAQDVAALRKLKRANLAGVIIGRALYEHTVTLKELQV